MGWWRKAVRGFCFGCGGGYCDHPGMACVQGKGRGWLLNGNDARHGRYEGNARGGWRGGGGGRLEGGWGGGEGGVYVGGRRGQRRVYAVCAGGVLVRIAEGL